MSIPSKIVLGVCCTASVGIILYVHYKQENDREQLHMGVLKDIERQRQRKIQNTYLLTQQAELTKNLQRELDEKNREAASSVLVQS